MNHQYLIDRWLEDLPPQLQELGLVIRETIFELVPNVVEKYSFRLPFYHFHGMFCYINKTRAGLSLCFCRGRDLVMAFPELEQADRKMVACCTWPNLQALDPMTLRTLILAAADWQVEAERQKVPLISRSKKS